jgi:hypothetical protein
MIKTEKGKEITYGEFLFSTCIEHAYIISKTIHTSYEEVLDMSIIEKNKLIDLIIDQAKQDEEKMNEIKKKQQRHH